MNLTIAMFALLADKTEKANTNKLKLLKGFRNEKVGKRRENIRNHL